MANMIERVLALKLIANTKDADKDIGKLRKGVGSLGKIAAGVAAGGLIALSYAAIEGVKAFREEQEIVRAFDRTIRNLGLPVKAATAEMDKMAERAVRLGFDDAETIAGMNKFVQLTGDIGKSSELMSLAWDISRSRQVDLSAAIKIASGVYKGSAKALKDYGIEGKSGMAAVAEARRKERGQAREWARNHPMQVRLGQIQDTWADLVGNLAAGNFKGVQAAVGKLGTIIQKALFGWTNGRGQHVKGLVDRVGEWGSQISTGILNAMADVDWGKTLQDTLNSALGSVAEAAKNGTLTNIAVVGGAIATAMFAFHIFFGAARKLFGLPGWLAKSLPSIAAKAVGVSFSAATFALGKFLSAAKLMFGLAGWGAKSIVSVGAKAVGVAFAKGAFVISTFVGFAVRALAAIGISKRALDTARLTGVAIGARVLAGIATGLTGIALIKAVSDTLFDRFTNTEATNWTNRGNRPLPQDPLGDIWKFFTGGHATGTAGAARGWAMVGERGPELVRFRGGESVLNAGRTRRAVSGGTVVNVNVSVSPTADKAAIGQEIIRAIQAASGRDGGVGLKRALAGGR